MIQGFNGGRMDGQMDRWGDRQTETHTHTDTLSQYILPNLPLCDEEQAGKILFAGQESLCLDLSAE